MSTSLGIEAEKRAALHLERLGFEIVCRNWKTPYCEIDIIATSDVSLHFVEVKYRKNVNSGSGLEYITPKKLKQMEFASRVYCKLNNYDGDICLSAISLGGENFEVIDFIESIQ